MTAYEVLIKHPKMRRFLASYPMELPDSIYLDNAITEIERLMRSRKKITPRMIDSEVDSVIIDARDQYGVRDNPPFYAHNLYEKKTHGLTLHQMRRLYRMVSAGNQKAITYARNVLGIPFSETPTQVKAVVYHHVRDLAERRVRRNPVPGVFTPTGGVLEIRKTGYYDADFEGRAQLLKKGEIVNIVATTHEKRGGKIHNYWVVKTSEGKRALIPVESGSMISWARLRKNPASSDTTPVVFRTFRANGDVIALFPYEPGDNNPSTMMSYQHIGQHGIADMGLTASYTRPSTPDEIRPLRNELEGIGYKLKILKRIPGDAVRVRDAKLRRIK